MKTYLIHYFNCEGTLVSDYVVGIDTDDAKEKFLSQHDDETVSIQDIEETFGI